MSLLKSRIFVVSFLVSLLVIPNAFAVRSKKRPPLPHSAKEPSGIGQFRAVDAIMKAAVAEQIPPGAVVVVGHDGKVVYRKAFGYRSLEPTREPMTVDTVFDMAWLTKCLATAVSVTRMLELGQIRLNDPVAKYLPEFAQNGKQDITIRQLVTHYSGLPPDLDLREAWQGYDAAIRMAMAEKVENPPGSRFVYSDINFIVLGELVHRVSGMMLD